MQHLLGCVRIFSALMITQIVQSFLYIVSCILDSTSLKIPVSVIYGLKSARGIGLEWLIVSGLGFLATAHTRVLSALRWQFFLNKLFRVQMVSQQNLLDVFCLL